MKKIKLLAPIMGATGVVAAIAPIALTSCNKESKEEWKEMSSKDAFVKQYATYLKAFKEVIGKGGKIYGKATPTSGDYLNMKYAGGEKINIESYDLNYVSLDNYYFCKMTFNKAKTQDTYYTFSAGFDETMIETLQSMVTGRIKVEKGVDPKDVIVKYGKHTNGSIGIRFTAKDEVCFEIVVDKNAHITYLMNKLSVVYLDMGKVYPIPECLWHFNYVK